MSRASIIDLKSRNTSIVELGEIVTYLHQTTKNKVKVQIVESLESDPFADTPKISDKSPLGFALLGAKVGDKVKVEGPKTYFTVIQKIEK
jgi:transcription elongation GreA/GreB family factor